MPVPDCVEWNISVSLSDPDAPTPQRDCLLLQTHLPTSFSCINLGTAAAVTRTSTRIAQTRAVFCNHARLISVFSSPADPRGEGSSGRCRGGRLGGVHQRHQRRRHDPCGGTEHHQSSWGQPHPDPHKVSYFTMRSKSPPVYLQALVHKSPHNSCCSLLCSEERCPWNLAPVSSPSVQGGSISQQTSVSRFQHLIQAALKYGCLTQRVCLDFVINQSPDI